ncbi:MAG: glycosyltransferase [Sulfitobacter sp.]|nr:glycosyltransferase [Sulfitobacter sp.]
MQEKITILMGVLNGAPHLADQLDSIAAQREVAWRLLCSDDGSSDDSPAVIARFARQRETEVRVLKGPRRGFAANYLHLLAHLRARTDMVALSDQDDIWLPDKLSRARIALAAAGSAPAMYCARRWDWWPATDRRIATPAPRRAPAFRNALVENIAFGNTIVLNAAAARIARHAAERSAGVFAHDWWLYLLMTGAGARVLVDDGPPCLLYRQHGSNQLGAGRGLSAHLHSKGAVLRGLFAGRISSNIAALEAVGDLLTPTARQELDRFARAREMPFPARLAALRDLGLYRQGRAATLGFWGAASLGRL